MSQNKQFRASGPKYSGPTQDAISSPDVFEKFDPGQFSPGALAKLKEKVSEYASQLIKESVSTSKRHSADMVSTSDVDRASHYLVSSTVSRIYKHVGTIGGIFLGTGIANAVAMYTTSQYTANGVVVSLASGIIGAFMVALHIAKE